MKKMNFNKGLSRAKSSGFTLIEILVTVAIIAILATVVLASLGAARSRGNDSAIQSNLRNAVGQGEIFWNTNTVNPNSYIGVCTNGGVGSPAVNGVGNAVLTAANLDGLSSYAIGAIGTTSTATCNNNASAWAAEAPLTSYGANQMWCVDSTGKSKQEPGTSFPTATTYACN
jgi:prepilin-type N-terminal cleavage/methylation domain-containing protein